MGTDVFLYVDVWGLRGFISQTGMSSSVGLLALLRESVLYITLTLVVAHSVYT